MTNILLLRFNNYFNRTIKRMDSVAEYISSGKYLVYNNINFYKRDGVNTSLVVNDPNLRNGPVSSQYIGSVENCDYMIEYDSVGIISRWFVIESLQLRNGQYELSLRRDVISDYYDKIIDAPLFVEKATVPHINDIAIYNAEDISFNQIKKSESLLREKNWIPSWIIGYYAPFGQDKEISVALEDINAIEIPSYDEWEFKEYESGTNYKFIDSLSIVINSQNDKNYGFFLKDGTIISTSIPPTSLGYLTDFRGSANEFLNYMMNNRNAIENIVIQYSDYKRESLESLNGRTVRFLTGSRTGYYNIRVIKGTSSITTEMPNKNTNISVSVNDILRGHPGTVANPTGNANVTYTVNFTNYTIQLETVNVDALSFTFKADANTLLDAPYKMFAIPCGRTVVKIGSGDSEIIGSKESAMALAAEIALQLGSSLYDIQLLPYLPWREIVGDDYLTISNDGKDRSIVMNSGGNHRSIVLYPPYSSFTLDVDYEIRLSENVVERKITNQCDTYRIVSPNYSAVFEFNPVKTGEITKMNVDCTYKPFSPYIHINPDFHELYGRDFDDTRGLIVQGDFSIPVVNSAWIQYQINNKNYLNSFNRNIDSIELRNRFSRFQDVANATVGTVGGAIMGAKLGGGVGGAVGGIASAVGGIADVGINEILRRDSLDLTKDQFNYSLENIEALPNTLAKVSSYDYNNKIFPIVEYYSCTDKEKEIFKSKMIFNGMKIMRIGTVSEFLSDTIQYIKGQLIRINIDEDTHLCDEIANELYKGVYL